MQRAKRIFVICILVLCLNRAANVHAQDSARQVKAETSTRKAAAATAVSKAKATAKAVQKAQETSATRRTEADKLLKIADADKAKITAALGRNASQKEVEKLTRTAQKSGDAARKAQEEADQA